MGGVLWHALRATASSFRHLDEAGDKGLRARRARLATGNHVQFTHSLLPGTSFFPSSFPLPARPFFAKEIKIRIYVVPGSLILRFSLWSPLWISRLRRSQHEPQLEPCRLDCRPAALTSFQKKGICHDPHIFLAAIVEANANSEVPSRPPSTVRPAASVFGES